MSQNQQSVLDKRGFLSLNFKDNQKWCSTQMGFLADNYHNEIVTSKTNFTLRVLDIAKANLLKTDGKARITFNQGEWRTEGKPHLQPSDTASGTCTVPV